MKFAHAAPARRWRPLLCLATLWFGAAPFCNAQVLSWSTPLGSVTVFGSGPRATFLQTNAALGGVDGADFLNFLDATSSPAISRSEAITMNASIASIAQLAVNESQTGGLPFTSGSIGFTSTGAGGGSGSGAIKLYFLIHVPNPVMIDLSGIRSAVTTAGSPADAFSLALFQSDATGAEIGSALLSCTGNLFDQGGSYQSSLPYYLVEMNAVANATAGSSEAVTFSFPVDLAEIMPVPEPGATSLLILAFVLGSALLKFNKRGSQCEPSRRSGASA
ncbi:MAG: hypothetical protein PHC88_08645 [Terrimicrobiaceae bacterium]|nr:hypothetical protein [Terrimicrobiaceae bacterium]